VACSVGEPKYSHDEQGLIVEQYARETIFSGAGQGSPNMYLSDSGARLRQTCTALKNIRERLWGPLSPCRTSSPFMKGSKLRVYVKRKNHLLLSAEQRQGLA
jgi:hypothetical protein